MNDSTVTLKDTQQRLAQDIRAVVNDAEALLRVAVRDAGQGYDEARSQLERSLKTARAELESVEEALLETARSAGRATDEFVHRNPWQAIGIGAGIGLLVGMLIARR